MAAKGEGLRLWPTLARIVRTYGEQARLLLPAAVILFVPLGLLETVLELEIDTDDLDPVRAALVAGGVVLATAATALGDVFYAGVAAAAVTESRTGSRHSLAELARTLPYLRLIVADVIVTAGIVVGLALLVVPGVVCFTWYFLSGPVIEIEGLGVRAALRRSRELVRGSFWKVLILLGSLYLGVNALASAAGDGAFTYIGESFVADWVWAVVVNVVATPFLAVAAVVLTYELIAIRR